MELLGKETLGFTKDDVGLHSIRSRGAMAIFLSGVSTIIIQRVGRWESDAFIQDESFYHLSHPTDKNNLSMKENHKSYKREGGLIVTPHFANFSYNFLAPYGYTKF